MAKENAEKKVQVSATLGRLATPSLTKKATELVTADINSQINTAKLDARRALDASSLMVNKYGLTGGEAATVQAGIAGAAQVQLDSLKSKLNLASKGQLDQLIKDPSMQTRDNAIAVQSFVSMLNDGSQSGLIKKAEDISQSTKDALIFQGFRKDSLDKLIQDIFSGEGGTIDTDFWNTFRSEYTKAGLKTTNK